MGSNEEKLTSKEVEEKINLIKDEIEYEKKKMRCCAYGTSDIRRLASLENELAELEELYEEMDITE